MFERDLAQPRLVLAARLDLREAGREDDGAAAAALGAGLDRVRHPGRRDRDHERVDRAGKRCDVGYAGAAEDPLAVRVHAPDVSREPGALKVPQNVAAVGILAVGGPDHRDRPGREQRAQVHDW